MKSLKLSRTATMPYAMRHLACDLRLTARSYWLVLLLLSRSTLVLRDR